ncbi:cephalosporin hydroxylase family protein [Stutzerimonas kunmingensis]|uniref:cephalosporin hydroxylase family protein n=1 Tax=Stutzerimonas kunmingensis TaxID=1211807 RepID=UPI00241F8026|nr:cephalosporin hydroxylase family protein [Stutzerimonas kunmingensis]
MDMVEKFFAESRARIHSYPRSKVEADAAAFMVSSIEAMYSYNYTSLGRPIIQYPQDMIAMQEIIWAVKPDLIIETGIAHGGSLIMYASALALIDYAEAVELGRTLDPNASKRRVLGIDIDIRAHNRAAIEAHPMSHRIEMIQGSSIDSEIISRVHEYSRGYEKVMVVLDSNHTHDHVLAELEAYGSLVSKGSYCVVFDTVVEDLPCGMYKDRPWDKGNNPKTAVIEYLRRLEEIGARDAGGFPVSYKVDRCVEDKLLITVAPHGYLRRV